MALFMVIGLISLNFAGFEQNQGPAQDHILGGPAAEAKGDLGAVTPGDSLGAAFVSQDVDNSGISVSVSQTLEKSSGNDFGVAAVRDLGGLAQGAIAAKKASFIYEAQSGDSLTGIAANFGISLETVIQANPALRTGSLKSGQKLTILPTSGILYTVVKSDTLAKIADTYRLDTAKIEEFNPTLEGGSLAAGMKLVLPGAKAKEGAVVAAAAKVTLASSGSGKGSYFIMPTSGFDWGILHGHNGVDIANSQGTPIVAAADGLVIPDATCQMDDGWNGGYGTCIMLQHANGTITLYGHLSKTEVQLGDYVKQGQEIGLMGSTGKSTGPHLHFEVRGASNPFVK